jgi:hypothetical protein
MKIKKKEKGGSPLQTCGHCRVLVFSTNYWWNTITLASTVFGVVGQAVLNSIVNDTTSFL